jgi:catechol 2,3-dioxygenase-like lactoylglutathione lyase family enzyme
MQLEGIDHVALAVRDVERSAKWYIEVLGFERLHEGMWDGIPIFIGKGNTAIALFPARGGDSKLVGRQRDRHVASRLPSQSPWFYRSAQEPRRAASNLNSKTKNLALDLFQ